MPPRAKVSVTLSEDVLEKVDAEAARIGKPRSYVMNEWLRRAGRFRAQSLLREQTLEYYGNRSLEEQEQDEEELVAFSVAQKRALEKE